MMFSPISAALPLAQAGKLRMLGVTAAGRVEAIPDVPPLTETGLKGVDAVSWFMLAAAAGTPDAIVAKLNREVRATVDEPGVRQEFARLGLVPAASAAPDELKRFVQAEIERWGEIVKKAGLAGSE